MSDLGDGRNGLSRRDVLRFVSCLPSAESSGVTRYLPATAALCFRHGPPRAGSCATSNWS